LNRQELLAPWPAVRLLYCCIIKKRLSCIMFRLIYCFVAVPEDCYGTGNLLENFVIGEPGNAFSKRRAFSFSRLKKGQLADVAAVQNK
jgi:hypothetical protein